MGKSASELERKRRIISLTQSLNRKQFTKGGALPMQVVDIQRDISLDLKLSYGIIIK